MQGNKQFKGKEHCSNREQEVSSESLESNFKYNRELNILDHFYLFLQKMISQRSLMEKNKRH